MKEGGPEAELVEWIFACGLRPNRTQSLMWSDFSRKMGWNDRVLSFVAKEKQEAGLGVHSACTTFELIELSEDHMPPAMKS